MHSSSIALPMQYAGDVLHFLHVVPHHASGNAIAPQTGAARGAHGERAAQAPDRALFYSEAVSSRGAEG